MGYYGWMGALFWVGRGCNNRYLISIIDKYNSTFQNHEIVQRIKFLLTFVLNLAENLTVLVK